MNSILDAREDYELGVDMMLDTLHSGRKVANKIACTTRDFIEHAEMKELARVIENQILETIEENNNQDYSCLNQI